MLVRFGYGNPFDRDYHCCCGSQASPHQCSDRLVLQAPNTAAEQKPTENSVACPPIFFAEIFKTVDAGCSPPAANFNVTALRTTFFMLAYRQR